MNFKYKILILLATVTLMGPKAQANLGDTVAQSLNRYGKDFYASAISSGTLRLYYTIDHKYLVQQMFTHANVVETICYIKMGTDAYIPFPLKAAELNGLRLANIPSNITFPAASLPLAKDAENEKVWKSDNGKFYIDIGTLSAKDCPFGVQLDCVVFATGMGYDNLQVLMHSGEIDRPQAK